MPSILLLAPFLVAAVATDIRRRRIPNVVTIPMMVTGLALAFFQHGLPGCGWAAAGLVVGGALLLPAFALGGMGAGDVKLLAGVGAFLGPWGVFQSFLVFAPLGAVLAILLLLLKKRSLRVVQHQAEAFWLSWLTKRNHFVFGSEKPDDPVRLPYAVPIALGTAALVAWKLA